LITDDIIALLKENGEEERRSEGLILWDLKMSFPLTKTDG